MVFKPLQLAPDESSEPYVEMRPLFCGQCGSPIVDNRQRSVLSWQGQLRKPGASRSAGRGFFREEEMATQPSTLKTLKLASACVLITALAAGTALAENAK